MTKDLECLGLTHNCNEAVMFTFVLADAPSPGETIETVCRHVRPNWNISPIEATRDLNNERA